VSPGTLISAADATVPVTVQRRLALPPGTAFEVIVPIDLSLIFKGYGPFPGVRGTSNQTGAWDHVGASRNPELSDGSTANERLTEYTRGHSFAYELTDLTNPLGHVVHGMRGEWTFAPDGDGTLIRWSYEFKPKAGMGPLIRFGLAPLWRRYMERVLSATARIAETGQAQS
jgi:Polyketide cyclase / dehydrase and lipid transport